MQIVVGTQFLQTRPFLIDLKLSKYMRGLQFFTTALTIAIIMECCIKLKWTKKQLLQISVYLSGTAFLIWQIWHTFQGFIEGQTTFSVTKQTQDGMVPPALLFCPNSNNPWGNKILTRGNISDKN